MSPSFLLVLAGFLTPCILGQQVTSPCPSVFSYESPGSEPGRWYGVILLNTDVKLHGIFVDVVLDRKADLIGNWFGDVVSADNIEFKIENRKEVLNPGPSLSIRIFVQYKTSERIPRVTTIRLNGREICSANTIASPATYDRPQTSRPVSQDNMRPSQEQPVYERPAQTFDINNAKPYSVDNNDESQSIGGSVSMGSRPGTNYDSVRPNRPSGSSRPQNTGDKDKEDGSVSVGVQTDEYGVGTRPTPSSGHTSTTTSRPTRTRSSVKPDNRSYDQTDTLNAGTQTGNVDVERPRPRPAATRPVTRPQTGSSVIDDFDDYPSAGSSINNQPSSSSSSWVDNTGQSNDYFEGDLSPNRRPGRPKPKPTVPSSLDGVECGTVVSNAQPLIVGGQVTTAGQWPWHVAIYQSQTVDSKYICGGSLISRRHIITAAHCVTRKSSRRIVNKSTLTIYLGKHNLRISNEGVQIMLVKHIFLHPAYNASSFVSDLAVMELQNDVTISQFVRPVCLWPRDRADLENVIGKKGSVVGWGFDEYGSVTEDLMLAEMPVVKQQTCIWSFSEFFSRFTNENTYCAGFLNGTSVCNGDSGGGMVFPMNTPRNSSPSWFLRGLVSLSVARQTESRCDPSHYVVFTDLAKYLEWIESVLSGNVHSNDESRK